MSFKRFSISKRGASSTELSLIMGLIVMVVLGSIVALGDSLTGLFDDTNSQIVEMTEEETSEDIANTAPVLATIVDQTVTNGTTGSFDVTISDATDDVSTLTVTGVVDTPFTNFTSTGTGATRTVSYDVASGASGAGSITVIVVDPEGAEDSQIVNITIE